MNPLAMMAIGLGLAAIAGKLPVLLVPRMGREFAKNFPRSRMWGWALTTLDMLLVSYLLWNLPDSWFTPYRQSLLIVCPVSIVLVGIFVDELLAARALGGLLLLAASPVLDAARFHPSDARLVIVILAYSWVVVGMLLAANPWWFRKLAEPLLATDGRCRTVAGFGVLLGAALVALGLWVY